MDWQTFSKREGEQISYQVLKGILDKKTDYQHLEVVDTIPFGRCLFLDGKIQSAEADDALRSAAMRLGGKWKDEHNQCEQGGCAQQPYCGLRVTNANQHVAVRPSNGSLIGLLPLYLRIPEFRCGSVTFVTQQI